MMDALLFFLRCFVEELFLVFVIFFLFVSYNVMVLTSKMPYVLSTSFVLGRDFRH